MPKPHSNPRRALLLAAILLVAAPLRAQEQEVPRTRTLPGVDSPALPYARPEQVGLWSEKLNRLSDEIAGWVAEGELVGAELLIVKDRKTVFHEAYGWSDREARRTMKRNSIFSIKSMSKPFTATAILMLAEEGRLSLDDPVRRYIPAFPGESTRVRDLLTHTTGYGRGLEPVEFASLEEWIEDWAPKGPTEPVGKFSYSDFNYGALGYIVGKIAGGSPIDAFTTERIIRPLGLHDTSTGFSSDSMWRARLNPFYWLRDEERYDLRHPSSRAGWQFYSAAWGMFSTAMDYAKFMSLWLNKGEWSGTRLLSEEVVEKALRVHAADAFGEYGYGWLKRVFMRNPLPSSSLARYGGYGYGWVVREGLSEFGMPAVFHHEGGDGTLAIGFPAIDAIVVFLTHSRNGPSRHMLWNRLGMLEIFDHPGPYTTNLVWSGERDFATVGVSPGERFRYAGTYRSEDGETGDAPSLTLRVREEAGRLHLRMGEGASGDFGDLWWHLVSLGDHQFALGRYRGNQLEAVDPLGRLRFTPGAHPQVLGLEVIVADQVQFSARRVP